MARSSWTFFRRWTGSAISRMSWASGTLSSRLAAVRSASRPGSSTLVAMIRTSGGMVLPSEAAFSRPDRTLRTRASLSMRLLGCRPARDQDADLGDHVPVLLFVVLDPGPGQALGQDPDPAVRELEHAHDQGHRAHVVDVLPLGVLGLHVLLGQEQDHPVGRQGGVDGRSWISRARRTGERSCKGRRRCRGAEGPAAWPGCSASGPSPRRRLPRSGFRPGDLSQPFFPPPDSAPRWIRTTLSLIRVGLSFRRTTVKTPFSRIARAESVWTAQAGPGPCGKPRTRAPAGCTWPRRGRRPRASGP